MDISDLVSTPAGQSNTDAQQAPPPKKTYNQVLDEFGQASAQFPEIAQGGVHNFAQGMNEATGTNQYDEGLNDSFLRRLAAAPERGLEHFGGVLPGEQWGGKTLSEYLGGPREGFNVPQITHQATKFAASSLGLPEPLAEAAGKGAEQIPAMTIAGLAGGIPAIAGQAALSTYGETGRVLPSIVSGATALAIPRVMEAGGQTALNLLGARTAGEVEPGISSLLARGTPEADKAAGEITSQLAPEKGWSPTALVQRTGRLVGAQTGLLGATEASQAVQTATDPDMTWSQKLASVTGQFSPSSLVATAVGQLPFTAMDLFNERTHPLTALESAVKSNFADRFSGAVEKMTGTKPTQAQIDSTINRLQTGKVAPESAEGKILASIGQAPIVQPDWQRTFKTTEGEWSALDAVNTIRDRANKMLVAQGEAPALSLAHNQQVYWALHQAESQGRVDKDTLSLLTAQRVVDAYKGDQSDFSRLSFQPPQPNRFDPDSWKQDEARLATTVTRFNDDGTPNPAYDPQAHQRVALVSGSPEDWVEAGIDPSKLQVAMSDGSTQTLTTNAIQQVEGTKVQTRMEEGRGIYQNETIPLRETKPTGDIGQNKLSTYATFAAEKRALDYPKPFDINDPKSVADFLRDIKQKINQADLDLARVREGGEQIATDPESGQPLKDIPLQTDAQQSAEDLTNRRGPNDPVVKYRAVQQPDGKWRVLGQKIYSMFTPPEETRVGEAGPTEAERLNTGLEQMESEGIPAEHLGQFSEAAKTLDEVITQNMRDTDKIKDPAIREGLRFGLAKNVTDFLTSMPLSKFKELLRDASSVDTIRNAATMKARMITFVNFLRDGGDVNIVPRKGPLGSIFVRGEGNLKALNEYMGELGYKPTTDKAGNVLTRENKFNEALLGRNVEPDYSFGTSPEKWPTPLNFFEQFYVISKALQDEFVNPTKRPLGDYSWLGEGKKELMSKMKADWGMLLKKAHGANLEVMRTRNNRPMDLKVDYNPLKTIFEEGTNQDLVINVGKLNEMFERFGQVDTKGLELAKRLADQLPFLRNQNVGFGIATDPNVHGYFHTDDNFSSAGLLLSPYVPDGKGGIKMMTPAEIFPHYLNELGHSATNFAYDSNPEFRKEVDRVFDYLKQSHQAEMSINAGKFTQDQFHALSSSKEMLASMFNDGQFHEWLRGVADPFEPLPRTERTGSMFDRMWQMIRNLFSKVFNPEQTNDMLSRVSELAARGLELSKGLELQNRGNIYQELESRGKIEGDILHKPPPEAVVKAPTQPQYYNWEGWTPQPPTPSELLKERESALAEAQKNLDAIRASPKYTARPVGKPASEVERARLATFKEAKYNPSTVGPAVSSGWYPERPEERAAMIKPYEDAVAQAGQAVAELRKQVASQGSVMESRVNPARVVDAMNAHSTYSVDDKDRMFFNPYNLERFRQIFSPALGSGMVREGNGYLVSNSALEGLTQRDIANMPPPQVKPYAPSIFETVKSIAKRQGSDEKTATAQALYVTRQAALLRNTEKSIWGEIPNDPTMTAGAWGYSGIAALTPRAVEQGTRELSGTIRHEGGHLAGFYAQAPDWESPDVAKAMTYVNQQFAALSIEERRAVLEGLSRMSRLPGEKLMPTPDIRAGLQPQEFAASFMEHIGDAIVKVPNPSAYLKEQMKFLPDELGNLAKLTTLRRAQGLHNLDEAVMIQAQIRGVDHEPIMPVVKNLWGQFEKMGRSALDIAEDQGEFQRLRLLYSDTYKGLLNALSDRFANLATQNLEGPTPTFQAGQVLESRGPIENTIRSFFRLPTDDGKLPDKLGFWDRQLTQFSQLTDKYPILRPLYDMYVSSRGLAQATRIQLKTALAGAYKGGKVVDDQRTKDVATFQKSGRLRSIFSKIGLDINAYGDTKYDEALKAANGDKFAIDPQQVTGFLTPDFLNGLYKKYGATDKEKGVLQTVLDGVRNQITAIGSKMVGYHINRMETLMAKAVMMNTDLGPDQSRDIAKMYSQAVQMEQTDPNQGMQLLAQAENMLKNPELHGKVFDLASDSWNRIQDLERFLSLRMPYFMSERRPGSYGLFWKDASGKVTSRYFADGKTRDNYILNNNIDPVRQTNPTDKGYGVPQQIFQQLDQLQQRMQEKLGGLFGKDEAQRLSAVADLSTDLRDSLNARDVLNLTTQRDLAPGREELDMFDAHQHYIQAMVSAMKNGTMRAENDFYTSAPEFDNQPNIKKYANDHLNAVLTPDSPLGTNIQKLGFLYYLFANPSSMIMQTSHQLMGLAPKLTERGASVAGSYATIAKANQMLIDSKFGGRYKDSDIQQMVERARREGALNSWVQREIDHGVDLSIVNRIRATNGKPMWEPFDLLKNKVYQGYKILRNMYDMVPIYNSEVAFVSSLLHLRSKAGGSLSGEELYKEANFLKDTTMFPGGKENRPGFFQNVPRSAAQGLWSLQTYANGLTTMMGNLIRKSANPTGLTPAQARQTRKAAAQMLIAQTAVAGVLGMPFAQAALYGLQKLFPEHNVEESIREVLAGLTGDDDALGQGVSTMLTTGIPSALSYGPDLGSRFALAGTFHVSPYSGVGLDTFLGPTGGILERMFQAMQDGASGKPLKTVQDLMPNGFQRVWKALEQGNTYTTESGQMIADNLRPEEIVARMIGFTPARIKRIEEFERLSKVTETAAKAEQTDWTKQQTDLLKQGRDPEVQQNIAQRAQESKGVYPATQLANDVAREYERRTTPTDLRKFGSRGTVLAQKSLRGVLGTQDEGPSNMDRLGVQQSIAQRLGLGGPTRGQIRHASGVDQLLSLYPNLTDSQANLLLSHAAASRPSPDLYSELLGEPAQPPPY